MNLLKVTSLSLLAAVSVASFAQTKTFNIVTDKLAYRNLATVESETEFETFTGKTTSVTGSLRFDPAKRTGAGSVVIDVASVDTGIPARNDHMRGEMWMDTGKFPTIKFVTTSVRHRGGDNYAVTGSLTIKGVTRTVSTTAKVRYRAAGEATKAAGFEGDVVQFSTKFNVKLSDYGVKIPDFVKTKVANEVTLGVSAYALAQ